MRKAAVICEFNPFHNGHKFLLEKIKQEYADSIVCIMSGNFVQRGDIAITDKYARTQAALEHGADMVAELPTVYAAAPAHVFADNGARLAKALGCEMLCFGTEDPLTNLKRVSDACRSPQTQQRVAEEMKAGSYYPKALSDALGGQDAQIIKKPNNILALEYLTACERYGLTPIAIPRMGVGHDDTQVAGEYASASRIRELICGGEAYDRYTPMVIEKPAVLSTLEPVILFKLKTMDKDEIAQLPGVGEGLEITEQIKTKRYTHARLRRILVCSLLDITKRLQEMPVPYARILGFRRDSADLLQSSELPLIIDVKRGYEELHYSSKEISNIDLKAAEAMNIARKTSLNEFSHGVIKL